MTDKTPSFDSPAASAADAARIASSMIEGQQGTGAGAPPAAPPDAPRAAAGRATGGGKRTRTPSAPKTPKRRGRKPRALQVRPPEEEIAIPAVAVPEPPAPPPALESQPVPSPTVLASTAPAPVPVAAPEPVAPAEPDAAPTAPELQPEATPRSDVEPRDEMPAVAIPPIKVAKTWELPAAPRRRNGTAMFAVVALVVAAGAIWWALAPSNTPPSE
ncbi:MAG: hypothetical protein KIT36_22975, partial [Alphaproteobacteria bacterium]|nr:hypothetical protein [Alphaproteobacteria bacterium]